MIGPPDGRASRDGGSRRRGSTIVETLTVMMLVSIVTRVAIPQMQIILKQARATEIRATFSAVQAAANRLSLENLPFPPDEEAGIVPVGLRHQLPPGFSFDRGRYQLDWENWTLPEGLPDDPTVRSLIGISVTTSDRALGLALLDMIPLDAKFALGDTYTFIFATQ